MLDDDDDDDDDLDVDDEELPMGCRNAVRWGGKGVAKVNLSVRSG